MGLHESSENTLPMAKAAKEHAKASLVEILSCPPLVG